MPERNVSILLDPDTYRILRRQAMKRNSTNAEIIEL